eukprot:265281_1
MSFELKTFSCVSIVFFIVFNLIIIPEFFLPKRPLQSLNLQSERNSTDYHNISQLQSTVTFTTDSTNFTSQIIDLINTKYNYTKHYKRIPTNVIFDIKSLSQQHIDCIHDIQLNSTNNKYCEFPDNISFIIHNVLGSGNQAYVYNVSLVNTVTNITHNNSILKYEIEGRFGHKTCEMYKTLYILFSEIETYLNYYNFSHSSLNVPFMYLNIPLYKFKTHCLMFSQQIPTLLNAKTLFENAENMLASIIQKKGNIINFLKDCYNDIMNVMFVFYELDIFYNDFKNINNILIDTTTFQCYVIDFGIMFHKRYMFKRRDGPPTDWLCNGMNCSPLPLKYLIRYANRITFLNELKKKGIKNAKRYGMNMLSKFGIYAKQYEITATIFHIFVKLYYLQINNTNNELFTMNEQIFCTRCGSNIKHWCYRQRMYTQMLNVMINEHNKMIWSSNHIKHNFLDVFNIFDDDLHFVDVNNCSFSN